MVYSASGVESRYSVNLGDLHSICEANYLRLTKVFPGLRKPEPIGAGNGRTLHNNRRRRALPLHHDAETDAARALQACRERGFASTSGSITTPKWPRLSRYNDTTS